jgi:hypothetical protein
VATGEILYGRHFEFMHPPRVKALAAVLAETEDARAPEAGREVQ